MKACRQQKLRDEHISKERTESYPVRGCSDEPSENNQSEIAVEYFGYGYKAIDAVEDLAVNFDEKRSRRPPVWSKDYVRE